MPIAPLKVPVLIWGAGEVKETAELTTPAALARSHPSSARRGIVDDSPPPLRLRAVALALRGRGGVAPRRASPAGRSIKGSAGVVTPATNPITMIDNRSRILFIWSTQKRIRRLP